MSEINRNVYVASVLAMLTFTVSSKCPVTRNPYTPDPQNPPGTDTCYYFTGYVIIQNKTDINPVILRCPVPQVCEDNIVGTWSIGNREVGSVIFAATANTLPKVSSVSGPPPSKHATPGIKEGVFLNLTSGYLVLYSNFSSALSTVSCKVTLCVSRLPVTTPVPSVVSVMRTTPQPPLLDTSSMAYSHQPLVNKLSTNLRNVTLVSGNTETGNTVVIVVLCLLVLLLLVGLAFAAVYSHGKVGRDYRWTAINRADPDTRSDPDRFFVKNVTRSPHEHLDEMLL